MIFDDLVQTEVTPFSDFTFSGFLAHSEWVTSHQEDSLAHSKLNLLLTTNTLLVFQTIFKEILEKNNFMKMIFL